MKSLETSTKSLFYRSWNLNTCKLWTTDYKILQLIILIFKASAYGLKHLMFSKDADLCKIIHKIAGIILIPEFTEWSETSSLNLVHVYIIMYTVHSFNQENAQRPSLNIYITLSTVNSYMFQSARYHHQGYFAGWNM